MLFNTFFHICIKTLFSISGHCQLEDADYQYKSGLYFEKDETDPIIDMAQIFRPLLSSLIGREWWDRSAWDFTTPSLYEKITKIMAQWDAEKN